MPNRIREYRERANLYQSDLGKALGVTAQAISKWELGKAEPDIPSILKMCDMFSVTADELLGRVTEREALSMQGLLLDEKRVITEYRKLSDEGKTQLFRYLLFLRSEYPQEER